MIHQKTVEKYDGSLENLADDIGNLTYDSLARFLELLSEKLKKDGDADLARDRKKLAATLHQSSTLLAKATIEIEEAWRISAPYMKD